MRAHIVRALLGILAFAVLSVPVEAQRRARHHDRDGREVRVDVRFRGGRPSVRLIAHDRWYYGPPARHYASLRYLARRHPRAFRRILRDHRQLHRRMRRLPGRRAVRMHRQWHRQKGWSHREIAVFERW